MFSEPGLLRQVPNTWDQASHAGKPRCGDPLHSKAGPLRRGPRLEEGGGSVAPAPLGLRASPIKLFAAAIAIHIAAVAIISAATFVPALTLSELKAALVEA